VRVGLSTLEDQPAKASHQLAGEVPDLGGVCDRGNGHDGNPDLGYGLSGEARMILECRLTMVSPLQEVKRSCRRTGATGARLMLATQRSGDQVYRQKIL